MSRLDGELGGDRFSTELDEDVRRDMIEERNGESPARPDPDLVKRDKQAEQDRIANIISFIDCPSCGAQRNRSCILGSKVCFGRELRFNKLT